MDTPEIKAVPIGPSEPNKGGDKFEKPSRPIGVGKGESDPGKIRPVDPRRLSMRVRQMVESTGRGMVARNTICPCGSGKRFKRCCMFAE